MPSGCWRGADRALSGRCPGDVTADGIDTGGSSAYGSRVTRRSLVARDGAMDSSAFDTFVRSLATPGTRRRLLRRLAALVPDARIGFMPREDTEGRGRSHGRNRGHHPGKGKDSRKGQRKHDVGAHEDDCGGCPTGKVCCGAGQTAACCDPRNCCFPEGGGGGLTCCLQPCCLIQDGPVCCLGICEIDGSGNFHCV
jgi:hypothetical protein